MKTQIPIPSIDSDPQYAALSVELAQLEKRLAQARERRLRAEALRRGVPSGRSPLQRAKDLVRGGAIPAIDPAKEIEAADREIYEILRPAIQQLVDQLGERRGDLSLALCRKLQSEHTAELRRALAAMREMKSAFEAAVAIRSRVRAAGYDALQCALPSGMPPAAAVLGDGSDSRYQAWFWLQNLELHSGIKLL
jgi:hypothetical protein